MWRKYRVCGKTVYLNVGLIKEGLMFMATCAMALLSIVCFAALLWMMSILGVIR